jgi:hypothetical protein
MEKEMEEKVNISLQSKNKWYNNVTNNNDTNYNELDALLEKEKNYNKTETWNKLDKTEKIQKLHAFSEKYGKQNNYSVKEIKLLKQFFIDCLEKAKLQKTKDVVYDKESREIVSIPSLSFNPTNKNFTLRIMDPKRVSTLKSLTPKRLLQENTKDRETAKDQEQYVATNSI